jgi:hypothetical protein
VSFNAVTDSRKKVLLVLGVSRACTDVGGTTPCGNGDTCNYLQDLSGNGYHAVKNGTNLAPTYRTGGVGGLPYLDFSAGASLAITPDAALNAVQAAHDYTLYAFGTAGASATVPGNGQAVFVDQCADATINGTLSLMLNNTFLASGGYAGTAYANVVPGANGYRPYYTPGGTYVRFGITENSTDRYRMYYGGLPVGGYGSTPIETPNTTGNIILGAKFFTTWSDWRPWLGQWHGLCYYSTSLSPVEVWQLDQYLIGLRAQAHALAALDWWLVWDGNSMAGLGSYLVQRVVVGLGIDDSTFANFAWHFKSTSDMIALGGEVDALVAAVKAAYPGLRVVLSWNEITNDIAGGYTAAQLYAHAQTYTAARLAGGAAAAVVATWLDQQSYDPPTEAKRAAVNALLNGVQTSPFFRAADGTQSASLEPWNPTDYGDPIHPNYAGDVAWAPYFVTQIIAASKAGVPLFMSSFRRRRVG